MHDWRPISFTLFIDDFGMKYEGEEHTRHLMNILKEHYKIKTGWTGRKYIGLTLDWDYECREVHLSIPDYVKKAQTEFGHKMSSKC